ncbi:MAG: hypothetical protein A3G57_02365 [Candidatus Andersenbacteria bacterium RIFCSPLOWO2_12_FULL_45_8]|nr:MAG: hypothetical protein UW94_C0011G0006 [Parcubacteria group bacterium GW2011_GWA2_45_14]OGY34551.1 MAG: hypothetical protein A3B76_06180 [Candidatus Andersenbacteria bacterium RIFCSPHIGHO2_02_FULL_46_16]OGY38052.1 MAG: hypothetical protein A3I08_04705 [Candidatus Andersenbacteria bacterium RIFCSPLOWO2_02_FULL_46_11]OGY39878.1 MAG: hypothetical protein A3G57_02365 [Candidatus Andersenbacteria bacterium RIFCSPLOWO2_12_FULL_45_8]HBE89598.1 hypothetical protein [Candidatus Andersenbacteria ba
MSKQTIRTKQILLLIKKLVSFSPRQEENETACAEFIKSWLSEQNLSFSVQKFTTLIPHIEQASLLADGQELECAGCSFVSGEINNANNIISSLADIPSDWIEPNINFNPRCPALSRSYYYWAPALAVRPRDLNKIIKAKQIKGIVQVRPVNRPAENILVGNMVAPQQIVIAHYDSIAVGATDNASGTAVVMTLIQEHPELAKDNLFVLSADEELSYDKPYYWGHGFRMFEGNYGEVMEKCQQIIVVDSVGNTTNTMKRDEYLTKLAFPIKNLDKWMNKISLCCGDIDKLLSVYHSELDLDGQLKEKQLQQAVKLLRSSLN